MNFIKQEITEQNAGYYSLPPKPRPLPEARASDEALAFIDKLPSDFVSNQRRAIENAIAGDSAELETIRASRRISSYDMSSVYVEDIRINGGKLRLRTYTPKTPLSTSRNILLYLHGGGWTINSPENCERFCRDFAVENDSTVVAPDYRLAPEYPYPAANDDAKTAYLWTVEHARLIGGSAEKIYIGGDSAGGHLAFATAIDLRDDDSAKTKPRGIIAFYPAIDLEHTDTESYKYFGEDFALNAGLMKLYIEAYAPTPEARKAASLAAANLAGLPRSLVLVSECDILRSEAENFAERLSSSGVKTRCVRLEGATHIYITQKGMDNAYYAALHEASEFVSRVE